MKKLIWKKDEKMGEMLKDVIISILRVLPEVYWCKFKCNKKIVEIMKRMHKQDRPVNLLKGGLLESLGECSSVDHRDVFVNENVDVIRRYLYGKSLTRYEWWRCLYMARLVKNQVGIDFITKCFERGVTDCWQNKILFKEDVKTKYMSLLLACIHGNVDKIVRLSEGKALDWESFGNLMAHNHPKILKLLPSTIVNIASYKQHHILLAFKDACDENNLESMLELEKLLDNNYSGKLCGSVSVQQLSLFKFNEILKKYSQSVLDEGLYVASERGNFEMVKHLVALGAITGDTDIIEASKLSLEIVDYLIENGAKITLPAIKNTIEYHQNSIFFKYINHLVLSIPECQILLYHAINHLNRDVAQYFIKTIRDYWDHALTRSYDVVFLQKEFPNPK